MVAGEIVAALASVAATGCILALRKSKCFIRKIPGGLEWGLGFTDKPIVVNELSIQNENKNKLGAHLGN